MIHVVEGRGNVWADDEWTSIDAGDTSLVPAGVPLEIFNLTEKILLSICFSLLLQESITKLNLILKL